MRPPDDGPMIFRHAIVVAQADIDALGHVSNVAYVRWVQDVALLHSESLGWTHARYLEEGVLFVVRRHEIDYLRPAFDGEGLELETWIDGFKAASSVRHTRICRDGAEIARAETTWALVSSDGGHPVRITKAIRDAFVPEKGSSS